MSQIIREVKEEAQNLANNGFPQLKRSLEQAYSPFDQHPTLRDGDFEENLDIFEPNFDADQADDNYWQDVPANDTPDPAIPTDWANQPRFKKLVARAHRAQNYLSLVRQPPFAS